MKRVEDYHVVLACVETRDTFAMDGAIRELWLRSLNGTARFSFRLKGTQPSGFPTVLHDEDLLLVTFDAVPLLHVFEQFALPLPTRLIDLHLEFRTQTNGIIHPDYTSLKDALHALRLPCLSGEKPGWEYLDDLEALFRALQVFDRLDYALYRARFLPHAIAVERRGMPVDTDRYERLKVNLPRIRRKLVHDVNRFMPIYRGESIDPNRFETWLKQQRIPWPRNDKGDLALDYDSIKAMSKWFPQLEPLRNTEWLLHQLNIGAPHIDADGRNRAHLRAYRAKTGRLQPKTSGCIFYWPKFLRRLIRPAPGMAIAEIDVVAEEFGIGAGPMASAFPIRYGHGPRLIQTMTPQHQLASPRMGEVNVRHIRNRIHESLPRLGYVISDRGRLKPVSLRVTFG